MGSREAQAAAWPTTRAIGRRPGKCASRSASAASTRSSSRPSRMLPHAEGPSGKLLSLGQVCGQSTTWATFVPFCSQPVATLTRIVPAAAMLQPRQQRPSVPPGTGAGHSGEWRALRPLQINSLPHPRSAASPCRRAGQAAMQGSLINVMCRKRRSGLEEECLAVCGSDQQYRVGRFERCRLQGLAGGWRTGWETLVGPLGTRCP